MFRTFETLEFCRKRKTGIINLYYLNRNIRFRKIQKHIRAYPTSFHRFAALILISST